MKKLIRLLIITLILFIPPFKGVKALDIYLFYGDGCPHCADEEKLLDSYLKSSDDVIVHRYEVWNNEENAKLVKEVADIMEVKFRGVPYTVIGDKVVSGYQDDSTTGEQIKSYINIYRNQEFTDRVGEYIKTGKIIKKEEPVEPKKKNEKVSFKVFGKKYTVNPRTVSLPLISVVLGLVDGFNPCAMWILLFLITMLFNMKDKKKMWILGLTFIITSGLVYLAFMLSWFNLASLVPKLQLLRFIVAVVALGAGIFNLNNYIKSLSKDDGCEVVDDKKRKNIFKKIRKFTAEKSFLLALLGVIGLAISVNLVELACSAGLPLIFTELLALNKISDVAKFGYVLLYILFFLIDDLVVFFIAMFTMKVTGITSKYNKYSHLLGGIVMLLIGVLLLFKPEWLMFQFK
jgi:glutaredoxin/cytochrome c biogenesis protein CcdA